MLIPTNEYSYSFDGEHFDGICYSSVKEALEEAKYELVDEYVDVIYVGEVYKFIPKIDADLVIEQLQNDACEEAGEYSEYYLEYVKPKDRIKLSKMLTRTFKKWAEETNNEPQFFVAENIKEYDLEDKDATTY